jgi:hypothetical protein
MVNNDNISLRIYLGTAFVRLGWALHQSEDILLKKLWRKHKKYYG